MVAALTEDRHAGKTYELSGPDALTFGEVADQLAAVTGRPITYRSLGPREHVDELVAHGVDGGEAEAFAQLFAVIREGRSAYVSDGVEQALGRPPRAFADYVSRTAATTVWTP